MQVIVEIQDEFSQQILPAGQDPSRALLEDAALKAFCEDRITSHELRVILGFETRYQLDGFLKEPRRPRAGRPNNGSTSGQSALHPARMV